jgi:hypothetical protein
MTQRAWYGEWLSRMTTPLNGSNKAVSA